MLKRFLSLFRRSETFGASPITDANVAQGTDWNGVYRNRYDYQRQTVLSEALLAWRLNPLARRITNITKQYVTAGIEYHADGATQTFLSDFWNHPLNRIGDHIGEWSDELALTGNLFFILTVDAAGMTYVRVYPTDQIGEIRTAPNDVQQETAYLPVMTPAQPDPKPIPNRRLAKKRQRVTMLHYAVNKLAGMTWGEPDIAPLLPWLARYASWLEDRVRLNRFRQAFVYVITGKYPNEQAKKTRQAQLLANPPTPGSVLVTDESETWDVINPKLDSFEANNDGLSLKKFIAGGQGIPLHWLAEPESSTRTTAEAAGTPTFKTLEDRQRLLLAILKDLLTIAAENRGIAKPQVSVTAADISERDNAALALASNQVITAFGQLAAGGFIDADEYLRIVYRFAGEVLPDQRPDNPARKPAAAGPKSANNPGIKVDSETGTVTTEEPK